MTDGQLAAGERLPSTRALAATLGVSRTVVTGAYAQLFAEGWIEGRHGSGTYVADGTSASDGAGVSNGASTSGDTGASAGASVSSSASFSNGASVSNSSSVSGGASRADAGAGEEADGRAAAGRAGRGWQPGERAGRDRPDGPVIELRPGIPWTAGIERAAWRRAWR